MAAKHTAADRMLAHAGAEVAESSTTAVRDASAVGAAFDLFREVERKEIMRAAQPHSAGPGSVVQEE